MFYMYIRAGARVTVFLLYFCNRVRAFEKTTYTVVFTRRERGGSPPPSVRQRNTKHNVNIVDKL
jgi:hypothetical protein